MEYFGHYTIMFKKRKDRRLKIDSEINIEKNNSRILLSKDGTVKIYAENQENLQALRLATEIAIRSASAGTAFDLFKIEEKNLRTEKPIKTKIYAVLSEPSFKIPQTEFEDAINSLWKINMKSLQLLKHSTDLFSEKYFNEESVLTALTSLELKLSEIIPDDHFLMHPKQKLATLRTFGLLPEKWYLKLSSLITLRNKLAHGTWNGYKIGAILSNILGGNPKDWLTKWNRISPDASHKVIREIIKSLSFLSSLQSQVEEIRARTH